MATATTFLVNTSAIAQAVASATNYILPSVQDIFDAGTPIERVDSSQWWDGVDLQNPGSIYPRPFSGLYYNLSYIWPQFQITGPIEDTKNYCSPQVCSLLLGKFLYLPSIPCNTFFATFFGVALLVNVLLSIRQATWGFMAGMVLGLLCEVLGYVGRILAARNDFQTNPFYLYIICLTIGPAFLSFSIYTCLARIVIVFGRNLSRFKPKTYTYIFAVGDFFSLVLQAVGGALATTANTQGEEDRGINIMIAGLVFQVVSLLVFMLLSIEYSARLIRHRADIERKYNKVLQSAWFRGFLVSLCLATITIFIRSVFRVVELKQGFHSSFANQQTTFIVLEGAMIGIAVLALTVFHPATAFGSAWRDATNDMRNKHLGLVGSLRDVTEITHHAIPKATSS